MAHANGAANHEPFPPSTIPVATENGNGSGGHVAPERLTEIREQLAEPFDPAQIKWRVTATSTQQTRRDPQKRGQLVAYADQRAYTDRLNEVFGEWGRTRNYDVQVAQNFERRAPGDKTQTSVSAKVVVVSKVTIHGLGSHTGVGEEWADDENAATRAEAQAFKRACACFGLGRYLYDLDKVWMDLDQFNRPRTLRTCPIGRCRVTQSAKLNARRTTAQGNPGRALSSKRCSRKLENCARRSGTACRSSS